MRRGLAYEFPMGPIYSRPQLSRVRKNLNKLLGLPANRFTYGYFDTAIKEALYRIADEDFMNILMRSAESNLRQFKSRTGDLLNSFGFAIYHNGEYQRDYTKVVDEIWPPETDMNPTDHSMYGTPQNALRRFAREYECIYKQGFSVVFMVGYPYSVDLETGQTPSERKFYVLGLLGAHFAKKLMGVKSKGVHAVPQYIVSE